MGALWSQSGEGTSKTPHNTLAAPPSRSWGPAPPLRAACTPSSILGTPWLPPPGPAVTQTDQLLDVSFSFNKETKGKKKDAEERVFKMPLAKNRSHSLMPDVKSLGTHSASKELLPSGWLSQGGGSVLRVRARVQACPHSGSAAPSLTSSPTALGSYFGPCSH